MIISLELQRLRNGEYAQLLQDILQIVEQADPAALQVSARYAALKSLAGDAEMNGLLTNYNDLLARRKAGDGNAAPEVNK